MPETPEREIRAIFNQTAIRVYQAYSHEIADAALAHGRLASPPFKMERMTWIKPSFLWMMYRARWGCKDDGQRRILAIDISREGFEWALSHSCPSHRDPSMSEAEWTKLKTVSPVRIQWDPERNMRLEALPYRSIQIGLSGEAVHLYVNAWTQKITDITELANRLHAALSSGAVAEAQAMLPAERPYPLQLAC